jgi:hypothetical protein
MQLIIRDDDINFFTTPEMIGSLYGRFLESKIPISFGVIPAQRINENRLNQKEVPGSNNRKPGIYPILFNQELCEYLANLVKQGVEICQHGLFHSYHEFDLSNQVLIHSKINIGQKILKTSIKNAKIQTFIAPYDYLSSDASQIIMSKGLNISASHSVILANEAQRWTTHVPPLYKYGDSFLIPADHFINPRSDASLEYILRIITSPSDNSNILVLVNHYWDYFIDWETPDPIAFGFWEKLCDLVLNSHHLIFNTFSGFMSQFSGIVPLV